MDKINRVIVVQGGQYGSEGKGLVCGDFARDTDIGIRTGTINAGHTVYYRGKPFKMQQLPCTWVNKKSVMVLGPGAFIHWDTLERELDWVTEATGQRPTVYIDPNCGIHSDEHTASSRAANTHHMIGTTGKGCSHAVVEKVTDRAFGYMTAKAFPDTIARLGIHLIDTVTLINDAYDSGLQLLVEGTQGTLLDIHLGPYPFTTHKQTQAANWLAECGLASTILHDNILVMRTMPIRVAGNSGPLPQECSWYQWGHWMNTRCAHFGKGELIDPQFLSDWQVAVEAVLADSFPVAPRVDPAHWSQMDRERCREACSETHRMAWDLLGEEAREALGQYFERTTVTNKLRRIALWDDHDAQLSFKMNRPTKIYLTFANYIVPSAWAITNLTGHREEVRRLKDWCVQKGIWEHLGWASFGPMSDSTFTRAEFERVL